MTVSSFDEMMENVTGKKKKETAVAKVVKVVKRATKKKLNKAELAQQAVDRYAEFARQHDAILTELAKREKTAKDAVTAAGWDFKNGEIEFRYREEITAKRCNYDLLAERDPDLYEQVISPYTRRAHSAKYLPKRWK